MRCFLTFLVALLLISSLGLSQSNTVQLEYFIDIDPGFGNGTEVSITPGIEVSVDDLSIATNGLQPGFHTLYLRGRNAMDVWGPYESKTIFIDRNIGFNDAVEIVELEYFVDDDPDFGLGTLVPVSSAENISINDLSIDTDGLGQGFHTLVVRGKSTAGDWGHYSVQLIYIDQMVGFNDLVVIEAMEYFFDTDPGMGLGVSIPVTIAQELITSDNVNIDTDELAPGFHTLYLRARSTTGAWGPSTSRTVYIDQAVGFNDVVTIEKLEYFIDEDPGFGLGSPIAVGMTSDLVSIIDQSIDTDALEDGFHTFFLRGRGTNGSWGQYSSQVFYVDSRALSASPIARIEYFIDEDPGIGSGTLVPLTYGQVDYNEIIDLSTSAIDEGDHTIYLRAQNDLGHWGIYEAVDFTIYPEVIIEDFESGLPPSITSGAIALNSGEWDGVNVTFEDGMVNGGGTAALISANSSSLTTPVFSGTSDVSFFYAAQNVGDQEFKIQVSVDGGMFNDLQSLSATNSFQQFSTTLNEGETAVKLRFLTNASGNTTGLVIDDFSSAALAPVLISKLYPGNSGSNVELDSTLAIVFDQNVTKGSGSFYLIDANDSSLIETIDLNQVTVINDSVYFSPSNMQYGADYSVIADIGTIQDQAQTLDFVGLRTKAEWTFSTTAAPPASVNVTVPNGGEFWETSSNVLIAWDGVGFEPTDNIVILASYNGGVDYFQLTSGTSSTFNGSYTWNVNNNVGSNTRIRITNSTKGVLDESDANFTIFSNAGTTENFTNLGTSNHNGVVTLPTGNWTITNGYGEDGLTRSVPASMGLDFTQSGSFTSPPLDGENPFSFYYAGLGVQFSVDYSVDGGVFSNLANLVATSSYQAFYFDPNMGGSEVMVRVTTDDFNSTSNLFIDDFEAAYVVIGNTPPDITNVSATIADGNFFLNITLDEIGTIYALVIEDGSTPPTAVELKTAAQGGGFVGKLVGLSSNYNDAGQPAVLDASAAFVAGQLYDVYYLAEDGSGNQSTGSVLNVEATQSDNTPPDITNVSATIADGNFFLNITLDEIGTIYALVVEDGSTPPTAAELKTAAQGGGFAGKLVGLSSNYNDAGQPAVLDASAAFVTGLLYDVYYLAEDGSGNQSTGSTPDVEATTTIDETAPLFITTDAFILDGNLDASIMLDEPGTVFFVVLPAGSDQPVSADIVNAGTIPITDQVLAGSEVIELANTADSFSASETFEVGNGYDIYFVARDASGNLSLPNSILNVVAEETVPTITILSPNGGENLFIGRTTTIRWQAENIPQTDVIDILLSTDNGDTYNTILADTETLESLAGVFSWTVPNSVTDEAFIRVRSVTSDIVDESDGAFSIIPVPEISIAGINTSTGVVIEAADASDLGASEETYTVSGTDLLSPISLRIEPEDDAGFEISTDGLNFGSSATVAVGTTGTIRVRSANNANNGRTYMGSIIHNSNNATSITIPVEVTELLEVASLEIVSPREDTLVSGSGIIPLNWSSQNLANEQVEIGYRLLKDVEFILAQTAISNTASYDFGVQNLESGDYEIRVVTTQLGANVGDTLAFVVDRTPPAISVDTIIARNGIPALTGTVDDTVATVTAQVLGFEPIYIATVNKDSTWVVAEGTIEPPLGDGSYDVLLTATDTLGNTSTDTTTFELTVAFQAMAFDAAEVQPFSFVANWKSGAGLAGYELQVAHAPDFTQLLEGFDNVLVEDTFRLINSEELYHKQTYFYRVRSVYLEGEFSEYSNIVSVHLPESEELVADSLALSVLYLATDGPNWDNRSGWFQDNRFDWYGVTFDGRRITAIDLSENDLLGDASDADLSDLTALTSIDLSGNELTGLSDLGNLTSLTAADVRANKLDFGDFRNQSDPSVFNFADQQAPLQEEIAILAENESFTFDRTIGGSGNTYRWFKVGDPDFNQAQPIFMDDQISFEDQGEYFAEVRNSQFEDIILTTRSIKIFVSSLERDSLALASLYETNGGENWTGVTGWLVSPITDWSNITIAGNRVTRVDLGGVGVSGVIPTEFATMSSVTYINLSHNEIDGLPDFTVMDNLDTLVAQNNSLEFDAILKNLAMDSFNFENQAKITVEVEERIREGLDFRLAIDVDGRDLVYQWYFNGEAIPGADSTVYNIVDIDFEQMGGYRCDIQNATVSQAFPGFTLSTGDFEILAIADLGGTIRNVDDELLDEGTATLYRVRELGTPYDSISSVPITNGAYNFVGTVLGDYLVRVRGNLETYFPTYVQAASTWSLADTIRLRRDDNTQYDGFIFFQPPARFPGPDNPNEIVGIVEIDDDDFPSNGRGEARRRVRRAGCGFNRARFVNRGEDDPIFELIAYVETNENGEFRVPDLPDGLYRINIEFPGIPMDPNSFIEFELGTGVDIESQLLQLAAQIKPTGITVEKIEETSVLKEYFVEFNIFPNPAKEMLNVTYKRLNQSGLEWQVIDLQGQQLMSGEVHRGLDQMMELDVSSLVDGIYLLSIIDPNNRNNQVTTVKFLVRK